MWRELKEAEDGFTTIEYALLLAAIAAVVLVAFSLFGQCLQSGTEASVRAIPKA